MAGPFRLAPEEVQGGIPTNLFTSTVVAVECSSAGLFEMTAGGSATEVSQVRQGRTEFGRQFGGVLLAVKNRTPGDMTVTTQ